ncbi:MAG TPA: MFS transporter [Promineifilum sp.]
MRGFTVLWFGQLVSMLGTGMTNFALSFYLFEKTGQATALTIAIFFWFAPSIIFSPLAGALVDRHNRKFIIILTDLSAGIVTLAWLAILLGSGDLELWQIYLGNFITGAFNAFQFPAFSAAVSTMIPKEQFGRAAGMLDFAGAASNILAPVFAGALLGTVGLAPIMAVDVVTFVIAILCVLIVQMPQPAPEPEVEGAAKPSLWQDSLFGFRYIRERPSLLGLQFVFTALNFISAFGGIVAIPMILARTNNNAASLATVQSIAAFGGVAGGLLMSAWGGPKRKVKGVLMGMSVESLLGPVVIGLSRNVAGWSIGSFMSQFFIPIINGSNQAIWQRKVPPTLQGRVFSIRRMIAQFSFPIAVLFAGPMADRVFEPAMMSGGALAEVFGGLFGTGPGSGMSLMIFFSGVIGVAVGLVGYSIPAVRNVEQLLPDFDDAALGEGSAPAPVISLTEPAAEA